MTSQNTKKFMKYKEIQKIIENTKLLIKISPLNFSGDRPTL